MADNTFFVVLQNLTSSLCIDSPSPEQIESLMLNPKKFDSHPLFEGIDLQCCSTLSRNDPLYKTGTVELYFDHEGCCILTYNTNNGSRTNVLFDPRCNSDEKVPIGTIHGPDCFFRTRNWVTVEIAHKYVQEFCNTGEISISEDVWEKWIS